MNKDLNLNNILFSLPSVFCVLDLNFKIVLSSNLFNSLFQMQQNDQLVFSQFLHFHSSSHDKLKTNILEEKINFVLKNKIPSSFSIKLKLENEGMIHSKLAKVDFKIAIIPIFFEEKISNILIHFENRASKNHNFNLFENIYSLGARYQSVLSEKILRSQKIENIGKMLLGIVHDLNNMFTIININCDIILNSSQIISPVIKKQTEQIKKTSKHSAVLMQQILNYTKRSANKIQPININYLIDDLEKMLLRILPENITLIKDLDPYLSSALVEPIHVEQIILNMIINAKDAIKGMGEIKISTSNKEISQQISHQNFLLKTGKYVVLTIKDNGKGIEKEIFSKIFEPFFTTKEDKGTGIGLATVFNIMQQCHGAIFVESEVEKGTTFTMYFPASNLEAINFPTVKQIEASKLKGNENILVVEDNGDLRKAIVQSLEFYGYKVHSVSNGLDAFHLLQQNKRHYDLVILDIVLPLLNGIKLNEILSNDGFRGKILFLTGYNDLHGFELGESQNSIDFLDKPFILNDLLIKMRNILGNQ
ncbi:ATP-binding protein [Pigmentibacter sp. JX0631]|uniref:ATP-binding protein n=1 Tax=Pigmentibacter sp. JX0631 TaxID=2976982 RepID=UPI0024692F47|nr:ATP-binding protein [Pigmentibacter sp. JX0631]WGL59072.1 ATP-binding protein [Pigmentibacter sp. JX0631]